ncbi:MAG TPA: DUF4962 domain-containing protein, partial [Pontiellaceae bacterium]|nr:DUF4962 domain-containing protein [Pontiellaceae bacterium]
TPLAEGIWYWQYAYQPTGTVGAALSWSDPFSFTIDSNAWRQVAPPVSVLEAGLVSNGFPRVVCHGPGQMGDLWPQDAALRTSLSNEAVAVLGNVSTPEMSYCGRAIRSYALMPTEPFRSYLTNAFAQLTFYYTNQPYYYDREISYLCSAAEYYDVMQAVLPEEERSALYEKGVAALWARVTGGMFMNQQERVMLDEHRWQLDLLPMLEGALVYYNPADARTVEALEYVYDLWNFKGPIGGRYDGGWSAGNGYVETHLQTLLLYPLLLSRHTGCNFFAHPWYQNVSRTTAYSCLPGHPGGAYGDRDELYEYALNFLRLANYLHIVAPDDYTYRLHVQTGYLSGLKGTDLMNNRDWFYLPYLHSQPLPATNAPAVELKHGEVFRDTGMAILHNQPSSPTNTVRVMMRACPWGMPGHGHAANNGFNLTYGGEKVFYRTGYYTGAGDAFSVENYRHTRAHNSILPYGNVTQSMDTAGYGWMARCVSGERISYCLGDASHAYSGSFTRDVSNPTISGRSLTIEDGYADPGVTRFRRHLALLETGTVVIYDELEAQTAIPWTFRLNSPGTMTKVSQNTVATSCKNGFAVAELYCDSPVQTTVTDRFDGGLPAYSILTYWSGWRSWLSGANHWHANITPTNALPKTRFLTLIHRVQAGQPLVTSVLSISADGRRVVSAQGWKVEAELDANKPSFLKIWDEAGTTVLVSGQAAINAQLGASTYTAQQPGSTMLMEQGQPVQEAADVLPNVVQYGNLY